MYASPNLAQNKDNELPVQSKEPDAGPPQPNHATFNATSTGDTTLDLLGEESKVITASDTENLNRNKIMLRQNHPVAQALQARRMSSGNQQNKAVNMVPSTGGSEEDIPNRPYKATQAQDIVMNMQSTKS